MQTQTVLIAFITSVLTVVVTSIFGPWVVWELEKRKMLREDRRQRTIKWRELVSGLPMTPPNTLDRVELSKYPEFLTLRGYLPVSVVENIEENLKTYRPSNYQEILTEVTLGRKKGEWHHTPVVAIRRNEEDKPPLELEPRYISDKEIRNSLLDTVERLEREWGLI
jgi:hypothetical protein